MTDPFRILLRNHQAGGTAAVDLFVRAAAGQRARSYAAQLSQLAVEAQEDLDFNQSVMRRLGVAPSALQVAALRLGERILRFKSNGRLVRRAPLSDVVELEGLIATVYIKLAGWQAAQVAGRLSAGELIELERLISRARTQAERLTQWHRIAATDALAGRSGRWFRRSTPQR